MPDLMLLGSLAVGFAAFLIVIGLAARKYDPGSFDDGERLPDISDAARYGHSHAPPDGHDGGYHGGHDGGHHDA